VLVSDWRTNLTAATQGGTVSSSFFDHQNLNPNMVPLRGVFYVDARRSDSTVRSLRLHSNVVMKLTITRSDAVDYNSGEMTRVCISCPPALDLSCSRYSGIQARSTGLSFVE
jgi:hypothetical protein